VPALAGSDSGLTPDGRRMLEAIERLPEGDREAFDLVKIQGMTHAEAAQVLGISVRTVKRWVSRSLRLLTARLGEASPALAEYQSLITALGHLPARDDTAPDKKTERARDKEVRKRYLARLCAGSPEIARSIEENVAAFHGTKGRPETFDATAAKQVRASRGKLREQLSGQPVEPRHLRRAPPRRVPRSRRRDEPDGARPGLCQRAAQHRNEKSTPTIVHRRTPCQIRPSLL